MHPAETFATDIRAAADGDSAAWSRLTIRFAPLIEKIASDYGDEQSPELSGHDLQQEIWLRVLQVLPSFGGGVNDRQTEAMFVEWLRTTARNWLANQWAARHARRRMPASPIERLSGDDSWEASGSGSGRALSGRSEAEEGRRAIWSSQPTPSSEYRRGEERRLIRQVMDELPDELDRRIVEGAVFDGLSLAELAKRWGRPYEEIRRRFHRTLERLERRLEEPSGRRAESQQGTASRPGSSTMPSPGSSSRSSELSAGPSGPQSAGSSPAGLNSKS